MSHRLTVVHLREQDLEAPRRPVRRFARVDVARCGQSCGEKEQFPIATALESWLPGGDTAAVP